MTMAGNRHRHYQSVHRTVQRTNFDDYEYITRMPEEHRGSRRVLISCSWIGAFCAFLFSTTCTGTIRTEASPLTVCVQLTFSNLPITCTRREQIQDNLSNPIPSPLHNGLQQFKTSRRHQLIAQAIKSKGV